MSKLFEKFRKKYKVDKKITIDTQENNGKEAATISARLNSVFVLIPLLKPYDGDANKVKLLEEHIGIINEVLNTSNKTVLENEFYTEVKEILQNILEQNEEGILIDENLSRQSKVISKFFYSLQGKEYYEQKYGIR